MITYMNILRQKMYINSFGGSYLLVCSVSYDKAITFNLAYCAIGSLIPSVHSCAIYCLATSNHYWYPHSTFCLC